MNKTMIALLVLLGPLSAILHADDLKPADAPQQHQQETPPAPPRADVNPTAPGDHARSLKVGDLRRTYFYHIPRKADPKKPTPIVIALHGAAMNGRMMANFTGLSEESDSAGFIVVYPDGTGVGPLRVWNAGGVKGDVAKTLPNDVEFIDKLIDDVGKVVSVDEKRVYATGMSNGGMMCYRLAADLSARIAAVAPVAGTMTMPVKEKPKRAVSIIHFHGLADQLVPFTVTDPNVSPLIDVTGVEDSVRTWAKLDGCDEKPTVEVITKPDDDMKGTRTTYTNADNGAEVVLITIEHGGHTWPGMQAAEFLGRSSENIKANDLMWAFFEKHPK